MTKSTDTDSFDVRIWLCVSSGSDIVHMFYILSSFSHTHCYLSLDNDLVIVSSSDVCGRRIFYLSPEVLFSS